MTFSALGNKKRTFLVDSGVAPQTISVLRTRAKGFDIRLVITDVLTGLNDPKVNSDLCGVLVQYPDVNGQIKNFEQISTLTHSYGAFVACATDLLALTMLKPPGEWGADIAFGNSARFGVPVGYGGPHAAFFSVAEKLKRKMPGRLVGRSKDSTGKLAYRLALQSKSAFQLSCLRLTCRIQLANSIFVGKKPQATFAPARHCWLTWPQCTPSITAHQASNG